MESTHPPSASLEYGTKLGTRREGRWGLVLYPEAGEAGGSFRSAADRSGGGTDPAVDPEASREAAARRARGKVRRYCAANRLNRLGTLTYAGHGCHDPARLRGDLADFFRRLRGSVGEPFPYLWVPEWHASGHGLHAHFAVGRYVAHGAIKTAWGRGFVHIKLLGDLPVGSGARGEARLASRYLSKYVGKDLGRDGESELHRYEVAQGFQPRGIALEGETCAGVLAWAESYVGAPPDRIWRSRDEETWTGPPAVWAQWR